MAVAARGRCGKVAFSVAAAGLEVVSVLAPRTGLLTTAALVAVSGYGQLQRLPAAARERGRCISWRCPGLRLCGAGGAGRVAGCASEVRGNGERVGGQLGAYGPVCSWALHASTCPSPLCLSRARAPPHAPWLPNPCTQRWPAPTRCPHMATAACHPPPTHPQPGREAPYLSATGGHGSSGTRPVREGGGSAVPPAVAAPLAAAGVGQGPAPEAPCGSKGKGQLHQLALPGGCAFAAQAVRAESLAVRGRCGETASA